MRFIAISDTHGQHRNLKLPKGDAIIHAGDFCHYGSQNDLQDFLDWFQHLDFQHKIFIGGNHDFYAAEYPKRFQELLLPNVIYLNDNGAEINGIKVWGSPVQPDLEGWAFGKKRGLEMKAHWDLIPNDIDILITHTPPFEILDKSRLGKHIGCEELNEKLKYSHPKVHIFGHVHASYGQENREGILFINASNINSNKGLVNAPIVFEFPIKNST